jgi:hypothetical protein
MLRATLLAAPLSALALHAYAADVATTIQEQHQFSTLAKAIESAGIAQWPVFGSALDQLEEIAGMRGVLCHKHVVEHHAALGV